MKTKESGRKEGTGRNRLGSFRCRGLKNGTHRSQNGPSNDAPRMGQRLRTSCSACSRLTAPRRRAEALRSPRRADVLAYSALRVCPAYPGG